MNAPAFPERRRWLARMAALAAAPAVPLRAWADEDGSLQRIRARGSLVVGLYEDMPPFHAGGRGIDVDLARALAERIGVGVSMLPFQAGENMADDLRNMVWKGHPLGWGPADVLFHVPLDRPLIEANPRVQVVAPYYRESVAIARRRDAVPALESLSTLRGRAVAVAGQSLAGWLMLGADDGALRETLSTRWPDGTAAARALKDGAVVAAGGLASELECVLGDDERFTIEPLPAPRAPRDGWAVGCAVKKESVGLSVALQQAMQDLKASGRVAEVFARDGVRWRL